MLQKLYDKIKFLCESKGISVTELERQAGIGQGSIGKWRTDQTSPTLTSLQKISDYFGVKLDELIT